MANVAKQWELGLGVLLAACGVSVSEGYPPWLATAHWLVWVLFLFAACLFVAGLVKRATTAPIEQKGFQQNSGNQSPNTAVVTARDVTITNIIQNYPPAIEPLTILVNGAPVGRPPGSPNRVEYEEWCIAADISAPLLHGGQAAVVKVKNMAEAIPVSARDVVAALLCQNDAGEQISVPTAYWWEVHGVARQWSTSVPEIEGGERQHFVLWINRDSKMVLHRSDGWPVGEITFGHWKVTISVTSANFEGFEATLGFTYSRSGIAYDDGVRGFYGHDFGQAARVKDTRA